MILCVSVPALLLYPDLYLSDLERFAIRRNCVGVGTGVTSRIVFSAENGFVARSALHYFNLRKED